MAVFTKNINDILTPLDSVDRNHIEALREIYDEVLSLSKHYDRDGANHQQLIDLYNRIGAMLKEITKQETRLHIFSFDTAPDMHGQTSRIISKLRNIHTGNTEFTYYMQKAFECLFSYCFKENIEHQKNYFIITTPVNIPCQNYAIHKLPNVDEQLHNTVMCVMLRGALLPSMIMAKEIEEYSSMAYVPDFALFRIARDDSKDADTMEYTIKEKSSFVTLSSLQGKDLLFPDPMNATGGSILTVLAYLKAHNIRPRSIKLFHAISSLQGALQIIRSEYDVEIYTLWIDPVLNHKAYIMPGLGDAGDRLNGVDSADDPRNIMRLIAHYGQNILQLYSAQIAQIEKTILGPVE